MNSRKRAPAAAGPPLGFSGGVRGTRVKLKNGLFRTKKRPTSVPAAKNYMTDKQRVKIVSCRAGRPEAGEELRKKVSKKIQRGTEM